MNEKSNTFIETLKASFFLNFDERSFQLEQKFDNYMPMWILIGILPLTFSFYMFRHVIYGPEYVLLMITNILLYTLIYLSYIAIPYGIFSFMLQNKLTYFKPLNLLKNLTYSLVTMIIYFLVLFIIKLLWVFLLETLNVYSRGGGGILGPSLGDIILSLIWLIIFQTLWFILMSFHINFERSKIRVLLSQIFIATSILGLFLFSFLI